MKFSILGIAAFSFAFVSYAAAQHAGDVEFNYENSKITFHNGELGFADGLRVFEAEFGAPGSGAFDGFSDEPGFISETDVNLGIGADDIIDYTVLEGRFGYYLNFWNPATGMVENTSSSVTIFDKPAGEWIVGATTGGGSGPGSIGQADENGDFHSHVDFQLSSGSSAGIYALLLQLDTNAPGISSSDPFWLVFNYGATEADHEAAVAFFAAVPEPGSVVVLAGTGMLLALRRRRVR